MGKVAIDSELADAAAAQGAARDDRPHGPEHAVEVQLPFLQRLPRAAFGILPLAVGRAETDEVATLVRALAEAGAFVVVSTDLSHYLDHERARALDARTAQAVLDRDPAAIEPEAACGVHALRGLVAHARRAGLTFELLDLRTSADTAGDPRRVVGYGAFALMEG